MKDTVVRETASKDNYRELVVSIFNQLPAAGRTFSMAELVFSIESEMSTLDVRDLIDALVEGYEPTDDMIDSGERLFPYCMQRDSGDD